MKEKTKEPPKKRFLRETDETGVYQGCRKLTSEHVTHYRFMSSAVDVPAVKASYGLRIMLEKMCRLNPHDIATHEFLVAMTERERTTVYRYINEGLGKNLLVRYSLISKKGTFRGYGYRPITYQVPFKNVKRKNIHKRALKSFQVSYELTHGVPLPNPRKPGKENGTVGDNIQDTIQKSDAAGQDTGTTQMQTPDSTGMYVTQHTNAEPLVSSDTPKSSGRGLKGKQVFPSPPLQSGKKNKQRSTKVTTAEKHQICITDPAFNSIRERLLAISTDSNTEYNHRWSRSLHYHISMGYLTAEKAAQLEYLHREGTLDGYTFLELVRDCRRILKQSKNCSKLRECLREVLWSYDDWIRGEQELPKPELIAVDFIRNALKDGRLSQSNLKDWLSMEGFTHLKSPPASVVQALREEGMTHLLDEIDTSSIPVFDKLGLPGYLFLIKEHEKDPDSFARHFGVERPPTTAELFENIREEVNSELDPIGLSFDDLSRALRPSVHKQITDITSLFFPKE